MAKTLLQLPCFKFSHLITCLIGSFFYISQIIFEIYWYYTSTHVVFVSKKCQSLSPRTIQARSTILRHWITIPQTSLKNIAVQKRIELLYFGRMALNKWTYHLIHVLKNDKSLKYHITLIWSGNVPNSSKITHIQHLPHSELITSLPNYHVFVLPSFHEGFPYSLLEAMAAGMLVITTPISDVTEYLDDRQIAETPKDFPKKIANLMTLSQSERSTISKKNIQTVSEHFSSNSFEKNIEKIIKTFWQ